jgi:hypothetical protein
LANDSMAKKKPLIGVAIYIRGERLNPDYVSQILRIQPSRSQKKGALKPGSTRFIAKIGMWTLKLKSNSRSISHLIEELLAKFDNPPARLDEIDGVEDACLDIFVPLSHDSRIDGTLEFALTKDQIVKLSQLGLSASFTVT